MVDAHLVVGGVAIAICAVAALWGGLVYWRGRGAGSALAHVLALAQTALVAQVGIGLLLLSDERRAGDDLHYVYGSLALGAVPRRLLWFAGMCLLGGALAVRAFTTGS